MSKIWLIGDTHFGVRNNSKRWEDIMRSWMTDFFFPLVDSEKEDGDILIHLGDVFDNRQSVCLSTMNMAIDFFEQLSERFGKIYVLCGNHDAYYTTKNDISSIECLKHIPNVNIVKEPIIESLFGKRIGMIPWTENAKVFEKMSLSDNKPDILFCHSEFSGCVMNASGTKSENNMDIPDIYKIYSGHIHHRQKHKNITYIGSPYQLTQNDRNNSKGVWTINTETLEEHFYQNTISPEFSRIKYETIESLTLNEFKKICDNKFVEIETNHSLMIKCNFQKLLSMFQNTESIMDLSFVPVKMSKEKEQHINISDCVSISEMLETYINDFVYCDSETKKLVKTISKKLING